MRHLGPTPSSRNEVSLLGQKRRMEKRCEQAKSRNATQLGEIPMADTEHYVRDDVRGFLDMLEQMGGKGVEEVGARRSA